MLYHIHLIGGPHDGSINVALRPYHKLKLDKVGVYETDPNADDFLQWIDDDTRKIVLHHNPTGEL